MWEPRLFQDILTAIVGQACIKTANFKRIETTKLKSIETTNICVYIKHTRANKNKTKQKKKNHKSASFAFPTHTSVLGFGVLKKILQQLPEKEAIKTVYFVYQSSVLRPCCDTEICSI